MTNPHLQNARRTLEKRVRFGSHSIKPEDAYIDLRKVVEEMLTYLEQQEAKTPDDPRMVRRTVVQRVG